MGDLTVVACILTLSMCVAALTSASLGGRCDGDAACRERVDGEARCVRGVCVCAPYHAQVGHAQCVEAGMLGSSCLVNQQCSLRVANSACVAGSCACAVGHLQFRSHTCLKPARHGDVCYSDAHCRLGDAASHCAFLIRHLVGRCRCDVEGAALGARGGRGGCGDNQDHVVNHVINHDHNNEHDHNHDDNHNHVHNHDDAVADVGRPSGVAAEAARPGWSSSMKPFYDNALPEPVYLQPVQTPFEEIDAVEEETLLGASSSSSSSSSSLSSSSSSSSSADKGSVFQGQLATPAETTPKSLPTSTSTAEPTPTPTPTLVPGVATSDDEVTTPGVELVTSPRWTLLSGETEIPTLTTPEPVRAHAADAVSLGLRCADDAQCRAADAASVCVRGRCDCAVRGNETHACAADNTGCHEGTFQCVSTGACISWFFVCDGRSDCADGSDERCARGSDCAAHALDCGDGSCVSRAAACDGARDCASGVDEAGCADRAQSGCPSHAFRCADGTCLPSYEFCNAIVSCADGSDEPRDVCDPSTSTSASMSALESTSASELESETSCPFRCANGHCRSTAIVCSGRDGCGDASDEAQCAVCRCPALPLPEETSSES